MKQQINLTVATDIEGMGGIASVVKVYQQAGFLDKWNMRLIASHSTNNKTSPYLLFVIAIFQVCFYMLFKSVGLVHVHMSSRGSYLRKSIIIRLVKLFGGKVVLHIHSGEFDQFYEQECNAKKQAQIRALLESCDKVIVLSKGRLAWCQTILNKSDHIKVIYNAVTHQSLQRSNIEPKSIAFLGKICDLKGVHDLINAFKEVINEEPEAKLYLAGNGEIKPYSDQAQNLGIEGSIEFLGWVSGEQKQTLLAKADIYCLPSYKEGFPVGVLEAMSSEIPVIASKAGGIVDAIEHEKEGLLIDAGDVQGLANAIKRLLKDKNLKQELTFNAKKKFDENFSTQIICHQLDQVYSELLKK